MINVILFTINAVILLDKFCPDPRLFAPHEAWADAACNAHYIWYFFVAISLISAFALIVYGRVVKRIDSKKQIAN